MNTRTVCRPLTLTVAALTVAAAATLSGCGAGAPTAAPASTPSVQASHTSTAAGSAGATTRAAGSGAIAVTAAFYPIEYLLTQVGGPHVTVTTLTKPGTEPHDLELTPADVAGLGKAALVAYLPGFQPAVDQAVTQQATSTAYDITNGVTLDLAASDAESEPGARDPHFWLDPVRYAAAGVKLADKLAAVDPANAADYRANAAALSTSLTGLDTAYKSALGTCQTRSLVTSHAAFGYLAARYGLSQVAIAGLSPDQEPSAKKLAEVGATVRAAGVKTIFAETLVDPKFAQTVATSTGATVATLDPVEGITTSSAGTDYRGVMQSNLAALTTGLGCR